MFPVKFIQYKLIKEYFYFKNGGAVLMSGNSAGSLCLHDMTRKDPAARTIQNAAYYDKKKKMPGYIAPSPLPPTTPTRITLPVKGIRLFPDAASEKTDLIRCEEKKTSESAGLIKVNDWCLPYTIELNTSQNYQMFEGKGYLRKFGGGVLAVLVYEEEPLQSIGLPEYTLENGILSGTLKIVISDYQHRFHDIEKQLIRDLNTGILRITDC